MKFDHIGVLVSDLREGRLMLRDAFGVVRWTPEFIDPINDVSVQFGRCPSGICYETITPLSPKSPVTYALNNKVNIVNHVAYLVDSLDDEEQRLIRLGFVPTGLPKPAVAYGGRPIQFFLSRSFFLFELIEAPGHEHILAERIDGLAQVSAD